MDTGFRYWVKSTINSYGQVFFSINIWFGSILLLVTFIDPWAGLCGLVSVLISNLVAWWFGFRQDLILRGDYGFNSLLVGLGLGAYFDPGFPFLVLLANASLITLFITVLVGGVLYKYGLPFLSIPFLLSFWILILASIRFEALGITERGVFLLNELYKTGDNFLVNLYHTFNHATLPESIRIYLKSLAAIFFQYNVLAGIFIAIGLLLYSRIAMLGSLISYYAAYYFYLFIGAEITDLSYSYIGFNFILSGVAVSAFYLIPSLASILWTILIIPPMVVINSSLGNLFAAAHLSIYSLPFNMVVLTLLYVLSMRTKKGPPHLVPYQWYVPEINLYEFTGNRKIYENIARPGIGLPFYGTWKVSQGYDGAYTHKEGWKEALDFIMEDDEGQSFSGEGSMVSDYYCYGKPVTAPADGEVVFTEKEIEDNIIGTSNLNHNWGNCVVIQHDDYYFTLMAHLKYESVTFHKGEQVRRGQQIGKCGNSGRSPYPHLHFQVQGAPMPGAQTIPYPIDHFIRWKPERQSELLNFEIPVEGDMISSMKPDPELVDSFDYQPGQIMEGKFNQEPFTWTIEVNAYNQAYIDSGKSAAYFKNDGVGFQFTSYKGSRKDPLFIFYLSLYRIPFIMESGTVLKESIPLYMVDRSFSRQLLDFISPFVRLRKAFFEMELNNHGSNGIILNSAVLVRGAGVDIHKHFKVSIQNRTIQSIEVPETNQKLEFS